MADHNLFQQIHNTNQMLWQSVVNVLLTKKVFERYELADSITATIEQMGEDAEGLPLQTADAMKAMLLGSVEQIPEIDPTTRQTLEEISRRE